MDLERRQMLCSMAKSDASNSIFTSDIGWFTTHSRRRTNLVGGAGDIGEIARQFARMPAMAVAVARCHKQARMGWLNAIPLVVFIPVSHAIALAIVAYILPIAHREVVPHMLSLLKLEEGSNFPFACVFL